MEKVQLRIITILHIISSIFIGADLAVPETVNITEGGRSQICATIENYYTPRERDVNVIFTIDFRVVNPSFIGKLFVLSMAIQLAASFFFHL